MSNWYRLDTGEVLHQLATDRQQGLSSSDANCRLQKQGLNELIESSSEHPWRLLWKQLTATMILILIVAALISVALGNYREAIAILAIVVFNVVLGFRQDYQAERAIAALKKLAVPTVRVYRDGVIQEISARYLVPGDLIQLQAGNRVPADCRILETSNLRIQESSLTGESEPVDKTAQTLTSAELPLGDRHNMAYMGTTVTYGRGLAVVTETGMNSELGQIAAAIQTMEQEPTRLQQRLDELGQQLAIAIVILITFIFAVGLLRGEELQLMFLTAVSLGVAAVPEGLPAVVTIALALGAKRMLKQHALIRRLPAVETLGSVTVICSDKTGTLTQNCMTVTSAGIGGTCLDLTPHLDPDISHAQTVSDPAQGHGSLLPYDHESYCDSLNDCRSRWASKIYTPPHAILQDQPNVGLLLAAGALCNDACLEPVTSHVSVPRAVGDPTEGALVVAAVRSGLWKVDLESVLPRIAELPFDSARKRMTTVHKCSPSLTDLPESLKANPDWKTAWGTASYIVFTKGALDSVLDISSYIWIDGHTEQLTDRWRSKILSADNQLAQSGRRILDVAFRLLDDLPADLQESTLERELVFVGCIGMVDPARPEVAQAVSTCKTAGIRPVMITGDHPLTAQYVARELGIDAHGPILTGQDLDGLSADDLAEKVESVSVYARVSPQHKLDIVQALQQRGHIVAMTGDGVNDAPALKKADIGVAMGLTGTDVAKEAADMVLLDDNFATIVAAAGEGRVLYDNIRKFIKYVLTGNCGELWAIALALFWDMPLLLLPLQILWINLIADGLLALALSIEPAEHDVMQRPPYHPEEGIFSRGVGRDIVWIGLLLGFVLLFVGHHGWMTGQASWQTMVFSILAFSRIGLVQSMRSERQSWLQTGLGSNRLLLITIGLTVGWQLAIIYVPTLQAIFQTQALSMAELGMSLLLSGIVVVAAEIEKWLIRRQKVEGGR